MNNPFEEIGARLSNIETLLQDLKENPQRQSSPIESDELLTVQAAAKFLNLSVATIYTLSSKGELPVMKRSKRCYFSKLDLVDYLKQGRKKTNSEISLIAESHVKRKGS